MKIDEQEFRSFLADLVYLENEYNQWKDEVKWEIVKMKVSNQINKYILALETPEPSKWKQLKLIE